MAEKNIISKESIKLLIPELKKAFASAKDLEPIKTGVEAAIKGAKLEGNSIKLYKDAEMSAEAAFSLDLPAEMVLDQANTKFVESFEWSIETYPESVDPELEGKPVLVLAVKGENETPNYSFLNMTKLVDTYTGGAGDGSTTVTVDGYAISVNVKISAEPGNALTKKDDGLFVAAPHVEGGTQGNLVSFGADGALADSNVKAADVLTEADVSDFTAEEIQGLLVAEG